MSRTHHPGPMDPTSSEADAQQLALATAQGDAYLAALQHMADEVADAGGVRTYGDYLVGYAIEGAEGMYSLDSGELTWHNPDGENAHIEIAVCDAADGRFIPGLDISVTLVAPDGSEIGPVTLPMLWHPMLYHYGANVTVPSDGDYTLQVHVEPPTFMRHDEINGRRFVDPVDATFEGVPIEREAEPVDPPE